MPTVLRQLSLIIAAVAGVVTLLAGRSAGVRTTQLGLRSVAAFALFYACANLLARGIVRVTPDAWSGSRHLPGAPSHLGQRLDVTVPAASPEVAFAPADLTELVAAGTGGKAAAEAARKIAADPALMSRVVAAMSQSDQEG